MTSFNLPCFQNTPLDIEVTGDCQLNNPYDAELHGNFIGPDGQNMIIPGFYNGSNKWIVRFSPTTPGQWRYSIRSSHIIMDHVSGILNAQPSINPNNHGALMVDPDHPHHFKYADGSACFLMGYECNWLWAMVFREGGYKKAEAFLDRLVDHGFNQILMNVYAHDTMWSPGKTSEIDYGPPDVYMWEGSNDAPNHTRMNPNFFLGYDAIMHLLLEKGISVHLYMKVYNKCVNWPEKNSYEEEMYFKYIVARYQAYPNVIWDFAKESYLEQDKAYIRRSLSLIKTYDGYKRLMTVHDDPKYYLGDEQGACLDFVTLQKHQEFYTSILLERSTRKWPVFNAEFGYEQGPGGSKDITYNVGQSAEEVISRAYEIVMAGGYIAYYYTYTAWDVINDACLPKGYKYFSLLKEFFTSISWWKLEPHTDICSWSGRCLADPGKEYIFYIAPGKGTLLNLGLKHKKIEGEWMNILTGERVEASCAAFPEWINPEGFLTYKCPFDDAYGILHIKTEEV